MKMVLTYFQIIIALLLIGAILLQSKGTGLGSTFGQSQELFRTKRGMEKILHTGTIALTVLFMVFSLLSILVN